MLNAGTRPRQRARLVFSPLLSVAIVAATIGAVSVASALPASAAGSTASTTSINASTLYPATGAGVTIYANVGPSGVTGTVNFTIGGTSISGCGSVTVTSGLATCTTSFASAGTDDVVATYSGNTTYAASSDEMAITVAAAGPFACEPAFYIVDTGDKLWDYNSSANVFTDVGSTDAGSTGEALNGLSFYDNTGTPSDANNGYQFGFNGTTMYRINDTGALTSWETFSSGFSDPTGATYWNGHGLIVQPDQSNTAELQEVTVGSTAGTSSAATVVTASTALGDDIVIVGNTLYSLTKAGDLTKATLTPSGDTFSIGTVTSETTSGVPTENTGWGSAFSDADGNIYFFGDASLKLIEFTAAELGTSTPAATTVATAPSGSVKSGSTDGATCEAASFSDTVTYNGNSGTPATTTSTEAYGSDAIAQAPTVTRTGYTLVGWNTSSTATTGLTFDTVTGNTTLYAIWKIDTYTVTYNGNGGTPATTNTTENYDSNAITQAPTVTQTGYTFVGWNTSSTATTGLASYTVTAPVTLYAIWSIDTYTVTYNGNGGTPTTTNTTENYDSNAITQAPTETRTGYTFVGWNTSSTATTGLGSYTVTSNVTLYAIWSIDTYTVTYNGNGGTPTTTNTSENYDSNAITQAPSETRTGYTLVGWNTSSTATTGLASYTVTAPVTLYAIWSIDTYTITYNGNGGTPTTTNTTENYDSNAITQAPTVTQTGYTFVGWNTSSTATTGLASYTVTGPATLYAIWSINSYNVTYNGNGGTPSSTVQSEVYNSNAVSQAPTVSRTGYTFDGWSLTNNGSTVTTEPVPANNSLTLYAIWTINDYNVTYNGNGGTPGSTVQSEVYNSDAVSQAPTVTRTGYTFDGWSLTNNGSTVTTEPVPANNSLTLYAIWTINDYSVTYNGNGGTPASTVQSEAYDSDAIAQAPSAPTLTGYTFEGWNTSSTATSGLGSYTVTGPVTLYAVWQINTYTVTYDGNGGTPASTPETENYGSDAIAQAPSAPTLTGYTFEGWNTSDTATSGLGSYPVTSNVTLYAVWSINSYNVTYDGNGGTPGSTVQSEVYNSDAIAQAPTVTQTGYTFDGWSLTDNGSVLTSEPVPANNSLTLYAIWTINDYSVTYDGNGGTPGSTVQSEAYNSDAIGQAPTVSWTGYTFDGWSLTDNGSVLTTEPVPANNDLTLYAIWTVNDYNVTYDGNGGTPGSTVQSEAYNSDAIAQAPSVSWTGYTFDGWSLTNNGSVLTSEPVPADDSLTLYAIWTVNDYNVTYDGNGGTPGTTVQSEAYNSDAIGQAPTVSWTGYTFDGWSLTDNGSVLTSEPVPADDSLTLYAIWTINDYNVTYVGNGGTPGTTIQSEVYNSDAIAQAPTVTQTGYTFDGWSLTDNGSVLTTEPVPADDTLTLYAIWTINDYNVTYDGNGGTPGSTVQSEVYNSDAIAQAPTVTQTGYTFDGWSLTDNGSTLGSELVPADDSLTLYAIWTINDYNVTYDGNGGTPGSTVQSEAYNSDAIAQAPTVSWTGYTFDGWSLTDNGSVLTSESVPADNTLTLYAIWTVNDYNVTYDGNGGTPGSTVQSEAYNSDAIAQAPTVSWTGYTFDGWSLTDNGSVLTSESVPADNSLTLYAIWTVNDYNVTYNGNGGTPGSTVQSEAYNSDAIAQAPSVSQTGYTFDGWSLTDNGSVLTSESVPANNSLTLYAIWTVNDYNVTYDGNGGTPGSTVQSEAYNSDAVAQAPSVSWSGYTFEGWSLTDNGDTVTSESVPANNSLTLYAIWSINSYNVTYNGNGGTPGSTVQSEVYNSDAIAQAPTVTQTGYTFVGWSLTDNGDTLTSEPVPADDSLTLYAIWTVDTYSITYNGNGGTPSSTEQTEDYGSNAIAQAPSVSRTGYTFLGWNTDPSDDTVLTTYDVSSSMTLYAIWQINSYTVTYNGNGGTPAIRTQSENYGSDAIDQAPSAPTWTDYTFEGWNTSQSATTGLSTDTVTGPITLYAVWKYNIIHYNLKVVQTGKGEVTTSKGVVWTKASGASKTEIEVKNSKVIFVAHAPAGTVAVYGGACPNHAGANCTVTMTGNLTVTVFFAPTLPVFYFATNKWNVVLTTAQKNTVIGVLKVLEAHGIKTLWLTGYADVRGSHAHNVFLGRQRANSVRLYLTALLKTLHLKSMSFYEQVVGASKQWGSLANDRRVEVSYSPFVK